MSATRRRRFSSPSPVEFGVAVADDKHVPLDREATQHASLPSVRVGELLTNSNPSLPLRTSPPPDVTFPPEMCCPVCLDPFHEPISLSCHHNVCRSHLLDLAAASAPGGVLVDAGKGGFDVPCPKCRRITAFSGEGDGEVNHELMALVNVVTTLLLASQQSPRGAASSGERHTESSTAARRPPLPPTVTRRDATPNSKGTRGGDSGSVDVTSLRSEAEEPMPPRRVVSFSGVPVEDERQEAAPEASSNRRTLLPMQGPPTGAPVVTTMQALELRLRQQRAHAAELREKEAQAKLELFKRQRREEIQRRLCEAAAETFEESASRQPPSQTRTRSPMRVTPTRTLHDDGDDADTEERLRAWLTEDVSPNPSSEGQRISDVQTHLQRLVQFETASTTLQQAIATDSSQCPAPPQSISTDLTSSAKCRVAEKRIAHLYEPHSLPSREEPSAAALGEHQFSHEREGLNESDEEVERRLWEVERRVLREADEQLTREEMADIAERRARAMLSKFRRPTTKASPKPTYTTKLSRMQSF